MNSAPDNRVKGPRVLVVEDHPAVAQALTSALSDMGAEVMGPGASPEDAQRLIRATSPDLALVDFHLANEEASELVQWLLKRKLAVIAMSGPVATEAAEQGRYLSAKALHRR